MDECTEDDPSSGTFVSTPANRKTRKKYAWVVMLASFLTQFLSPSINYASGVIHVALLDRYDSDVTLTAWVGSVYTCMFALAGE